MVGEVENGLSRSIDFVKVTGTFYDVNNNVIGTDFTFTDPDTLEVGETAPFDLTFYTEAIDPSEVATYKIRVSWR
ncbi:MAG: FxLYD domain-containing protein [Nitrososphaeraceae archaeon]